MLAKNKPILKLDLASWLECSNFGYTASSDALHDVTWFESSTYPEVAQLSSYSLPNDSTYELR